MSVPFVRRVNPRSALLLTLLGVLAIALSTNAVTSAQGNKKQTNQSGLSNLQRMDIMRSKLESMRRSLDSAVAAINAKDTGNKEKSADDPRTRLRGLDKEASSVLSEINDLRAKEERV